MGLVKSISTLLFYYYVDVASSSHIGSGTIRLYRNGYTLSSYYHGIVQIYINGQWGKSVMIPTTINMKLMSSVISWDILEPQVILELGQ